MNMQELLESVPEAQRAEAAAILTEYGTGMLAMAREEVLATLHRLLAGDIEAVRDVLMRGGWAALADAAEVNAENWDRVQTANIKARELADDALMRMIPVVGAILLGLVGL